MLVPSTKQEELNQEIVLDFILSQLDKSNMRSGVSSTSPSQLWKPSNNCEITPSPPNSAYGACSATICNTTGKQTRNKNILTRLESGLGTCSDTLKLTLNQTESTSCSATPCPVDCELTPSNSPYGDCSVPCGTGTQTRLKYMVKNPSVYGGKCDNKDELDSIPCNTTPCPVDCVLTPSGLMYTPCSATECGTTGEQTRMKYIVKTPSMYGGNCDGKDDIERTPCSAVKCVVETVTPTPTSKSGDESFIEKNKWYVIAGVILLLILIGVGIVAMKKNSN
jgi:hypothetical protein